MGREAPRHPITSAAYLAALEKAARAVALPQAYRDMVPDIVDRLRCDDRVEAALNRLRVKTDAETQVVLDATIKAATFALRPGPWRAAVAARAANSKTAVDLVERVLALDHDASIQISFFHRHALADLLVALKDDAARFAGLPRAIGVSQKPDAAITMLRELRKLLFGAPSRLSPRGRTALVWLATAALGGEISDATVTAALRSPRSRGDFLRKNPKKSPL